MRASRAIVLARGLGSRMREPDPAARLNPAQQRAADAGLKAMLPVHGRPFLDYVLSVLADAGLSRIALVVAPDHALIRDHYAAQPPTRLALDYVVQVEALGTANAVLAATAWTGGEPFLVLNADNLYPLQALVDLAALDEPGLPAFERDELIQSSNIPEARVRSFALVEVDRAGYLTKIVEKPSGDALDRPGAIVSMNCWRFDTRIFEACRDVPRSGRGEFELPEAVGLAVDRGMRLKAVPASGPVLDLSRRADAADVEPRLRGKAPRP